MTKHLYIISFILLTSTCWGQTQNYWTKKADFSGLKRERAVAFSIGEFGYVGTGVDTTDVVKNDFWKYDPTLNSWTQIADLPATARRNAIGFSIEGLGYVGTGMDNAEAGLGSPLSDFWSYDPNTNSWTAKASYPGSGFTGVYFATGFSADGKGYICGGKRGPNNYTDEFWEYKPLLDTWAQRDDFPGGIRYQLCSFTVDNLAYVGLGIDQDVFRKDFYQYNPATNSWLQLGDFTGGERGSVCTFNLGERGFVCLGTDGGFKGDLWEYNTYSDAWSIRANYGGSERKNAAAFVINDKAYVGTGKGVSGKKMSMYVYTPYESALKINENDLSKTVVYPSVIHNTATINLPSNELHFIKLLSLNGQVLQNFYSSSSIVELNRNNESKGVYLLLIEDENHTIIHKQKLIFK